MTANLTRRKLCQSAGVALMMLPVITVCTDASAKTNLSMREKLKYQSQPKEGMSCAACLEYLPGSSDQSVGGCKVIPEDDEISARAYCVAWNTM